MLQDFESFIHKVLACLGLVLSGGGRNYLLTNSQIIRTTFDNCSSCYFMLQTRILLTVPLVFYMLESIPPGFDYYATCSYLFYARIHPHGFCLLFYLLFLLCLKPFFPSVFAYYFTCYFFRLDAIPRGFAYCPTCYLFNARIHPPRFCLLFHLLFTFC
jgi:hypothetical protein